MKLRTYLVTFWLLLGASLSYAQTTANGGSEYIELQPPFIVTYGGPGPLKYLKTEVTLIVPSVEAEVKVKKHTPPIRNSLVMLLSRQRSENVSSTEGRDQIRLQALEDLRQVMIGEYGDSGYDLIKDLLFTSFVVQE